MICSQHKDLFVKFHLFSCHSAMLPVFFFQVKCSLDEESEATLLTALTEILDNVDDENLSPFDTLPDSDLFSGQKGQEHSPVSPPQLVFTSLSMSGMHKKVYFCFLNSLMRFEQQILIFLYPLQLRKLLTRSPPESLIHARQFPGKVF